MENAYSTLKNDKVTYILPIFIAASAILKITYNRLLDFGRVYSACSCPNDGNAVLIPFVGISCMLGDYF